MRQIKFRYRIKILDTEEIVTRYYTLYEVEQKDFGHNDVKPESEVLSRDQWTGLHDKNGKEIYEGDIVAISANSKEELCGDGSGMGTVVWDEKKFTWTWKYNLEICPWNKNVVEWAEKSLIIGSIYENPKLLKQ